MKILQVNKLYYPVIGGIETTVRNIAENLNKKDLKVSVLACQKKGSRQEEEINGVTVYRAASWGKKLGMPLSFDFFRFFKKTVKDYDIILIHHPFPLAFLALPFISKKKIFIMYHSDIVRQKILALPFLPFIKYGLKRAEKIFVGGENIIKYSPLLKKHRNKCVIIPFGLNLTNYQTTPKLLEEAELIKEKYKQPLLLTVGRLVYYKGFQYLISAMAKIEANLIIIGQGAKKKQLEKLIKKLELTNKINIIDHVPDLKSYYLASDLFIFPSCARSEAFGLVQLEAMAYQKPVINTYLKTAVEEVSLNNVTGLTVPIKDSIALAEAINNLLNDPEKRKKFGRAAELRVQMEFKNEYFLTKLSSVLQSS